MAFPEGTDFADLLGRLARGLEGQGLPFMVIGGQAVLLHGEARLTQDIDLTVAAGLDRLPDVMAAVHDARLVPLTADVEGFARETLVVPVVDERTGTRVDIVLSHTDYEEQAINRALALVVGGTSVPFATAEDLLLHKLFAGRPRDIEDVQGVVRRKGRELDWPYIRRWAAEFSQVPGREDLPAIAARLERDAQP